MSDSTVNVADILKYAVKIEHESMLFYTQAADIVTDEAVQKLVSALRSDEVQHQAYLEQLLKVTADSNKPVEFDEQLLRKIVTNPAIPPGAGAKDVLLIALDREKNTRNLYNTIATMSNLDNDVVELFEMLYDQESNHVLKIEYRLERL
ncbi:ferritin family protein [bacterium]|nr:ferritin family protein [bacterium]